MNTHFNNLIIYYFSGTGNAKNVANWISEVAKERNISVQEYDISKLKGKIPEPPQNSCIGFISPTHGFNFPPLMLHFILKFPRSTKNKAFIINTRGGLKLGKYFIPGLSGLTQFFSALILWMKGFKVIGMHPIDLPSNWISLHPGLKPKVISSIYDKRKKEVFNFANKILNGGKNYKALRDIIQDMLLAPIAILYYLVGRFVFAKTFIASRDCNNCNLCINECPIKAIKKINQRPFWTYKCESCMHCMNNCPQRAIQTAHGFIAGVLFLVNSIILYQTYTLLNIDKIIIDYFPDWLSILILNIFETIILFGFLFLSYRIMHYLLKFPLFEKLIVLTSLTKYSFWRRYKIKHSFTEKT
jgi:ferredoxin